MLVVARPRHVAADVVQQRRRLEEQALALAEPVHGAQPVEDRQRQLRGHARVPFVEVEAPPLHERRDAHLPHPPLRPAARRPDALLQLQQDSVEQPHVRHVQLLRLQ